MRHGAGTPHAGPRIVGGLLAVAVLVVVALAAWGCSSSGEPVACTVPCATDEECPSGWTCQSGYCAPPGQTERCGVAPADAGVPDASAIEVGAVDAGGDDAPTTDAVATDAEGADAGATDAVATDGGAVDAGGADAPATDAAATDAEAGDGGATDAAAPDAGSGLPSCVGLQDTCGPAGAASCCASAEVPGGTFYRGYDLATDGLYDDQTKPATVSTFPLDLYEVTVGRFRTFVEAGGGTQESPPAAGAGKNPNNPSDPGWDAAWNTALVGSAGELSGALNCSGSFVTWTSAPGANENRPINCVTWYEAVAFCIWDGGRLPTEAEWHYAASGGSEQRAYPWSDPAGSTTIDSSYASYDCLGDGTAGCALADIIDVGTKPAGNGSWGHADLGGNLWEWVLDWSGDYPVPCSDCANLTPGTFRVVRGGGFVGSESYLRSAYHSSYSPGDRSVGHGFRCARMP